MFYVYILQSKNSPRKFYTGYSTDLKQRLVAHNYGDNPSTKKYKPWILIWYGAFLDKDKAKQFEYYLKSNSGRSLRNKRLV